MGTASAGWHPDPLGRHQYRYWSGAEWTEHVSDGGTVSADPLATVPPPEVHVPPATAPTSLPHDGPASAVVSLTVPTRRTRNRWLVAGGVAAAAVLASVGTWVVTGRDSGSTHETTKPIVTIPAATPGSTTPGSTTPVITAPPITGPTTTAPIPTTAPPAAVADEASLAAYAASVGAISTSGVVTSSCPPAAVVVATDATQIVTWDGSAWAAQGFPAQAAGTEDTSADGVVSLDITGDGTLEVLVGWNADEETMHAYGGVLSLTTGDCSWQWLPIVHPDGSTSLLIDGLYADSGVLHATDYLSMGGKAPVTIRWDGSSLVVVWENAVGSPLTNRCSSDRYGFAISYPADWYTRDDTPQLTCTEFDMIPIVYEDGGEGSTEWYRPITVYLAQSLFEDYIATYDQFPAGTVLSNVETTVAGRTARRVDVVSDGQFEMPEGWTMIDYVIDLDGSVLAVSGLVRSADEEDLVESTLEVMLETLRIL